MSERSRRGVCWRRWIGLVALAIAALVPVDQSFAQCPGAWSDEWGMPRPEGTVEVIAELANGDIMVGGSNFPMSSTTWSSLAIYSASTATWQVLQTANDSSVYSLLPLPGGDVLVGGSFTSIGGISAQRIARYSPATGDWSALGTGVVDPNGAYVRELLLLPGGEVLVGGQFTSAGGVTVKGLAKYYPDTNTWVSPGVGVAATTGPAYVDALAVLPDGRVFAGGRFSSAGGLAATSVAVLDPSTGAWTIPSPPPVGTSLPLVHKAIVLESGDVAFGGYFSTVSGIASPNLARYRPATNDLAPIGSAPGLPTANTNVHALLELPGGDLLVGGFFGTVNGLTVNSLVRINMNTGAYSVVGLSSGGVRQTGSSLGSVYALKAISSGDVLVGGKFVSADGAAIGALVRYLPATNAFTPLGRGMNAQVHALARLPDGRVMAGGSFTSAGEVLVNRVAIFDPATRVWSPLGYGIEMEDPLWQGQPYVLAFTVLANGDVIVGGVFNMAGGGFAYSIARYVASTGAWMSLGDGVPEGYVNAVVELPNGDLIIGGYFVKQIGPYSAGSIVRYRPSTGAWFRVSNIDYDDVFALHVLDDGDVLVAGGSVRRYRPSTNTYWPYVSGTGIWGAYTFARLPDGDVLVGGEFNLGGGTAKGIVRYHSSTDTWAPVGGGGATGSINTIVVLPNNEVLVGGSFDPVGPIPLVKVAKLNLTTDAWSAMEGGTNDYVWDMVVLANSEVMIGGRFTVANGTQSRYIASYTLEGSCRADYDCTNSVTIDDLFQYINGYFTGAPAADFNGVGGVTIDDLFLYINAYFVGC